MNILKSLAGTILVSLTTVSFAQAGNVTLTIDTGAVTGSLRAAAFESQEGFDTSMNVGVASAVAEGGLAELTFAGLKPGAYGIAVYLDTNGNAELDTNLFGAPTEPFGFSGNPQLGFSAPKFDAFKFDHDGTDLALEIKLNGN